ncbi:TPA: hypothetical protein U0D28_001577 [Listeria monocytogenes]|nr:hypothetical protein [Listeria monocytogenes]EKN1188455.1 hypothetical protein [Listeria monocytogenes]HAA4416729.1 hypothetical protein [Listeria monocytogenes]HAM1162939.1 hypothetical protein [Listeria monocytogenes]HEL8349084.1 hypothetical protein [Listeria monocytogenes]
MNLKSILIGGLVVSLSFAGTPINAVASEGENDVKEIYEAPEITDINDTYDLAVEQEASGDKTIEVAGEEFPIMDEGSKASIEGLGEKEAVDTKTATEVLSVEEDSDGDVSAEMVTTTIADITSSEGEISDNIAPKPLLKASYTHMSAKEQFDSKKNVYVTIKVYYHFQKKSNKDDHIDMNYIMVGAKEQNKATKITSANLTMIQRGFTQYGFYTDKYKQREMGSYSLLRVNVPDSWSPVSTIAGIVGGEHKVYYQKAGKKYSVTVKNYPQNNLQ